MSQRQFWPEFDLSDYGDGEVKGIISVDVSDWEKPGLLYGKPAKLCTREEIKNEVWAQLKQSLNVNGEVVLEDDNLHDWFLDEDIRTPNPEGAAVNLEPPLVNKIHTWSLRPTAETAIPNLFLASDYVRTNTDLATMEGANEAARHAVNAIIDRSGADARKCKIWEMYQFPFCSPTGFTIRSVSRKVCRGTEKYSAAS
ncbi:FAD-dependent oxidoreductase [Paenibacillus sp. P25]|nr:FAD-dependent oxidoreductase [Paenibacillus sp. P25]